MEVWRKSKLLSTVFSCCVMFRVNSSSYLPLRLIDNLGLLAGLDSIWICTIRWLSRVTHNGNCFNLFLIPTQSYVICVSIALVFMYAPLLLDDSISSIS